jgi:hypothetical protein
MTVAEWAKRPAQPMPVIAPTASPSAMRAAWLPEPDAPSWMLLMSPERPKTLHRDSDCYSKTTDEEHDAMLAKRAAQVEATQRRREAEADARAVARKEREALERRLREERAKANKLKGRPTHKHEFLID